MVRQIRDRMLGPIRNKVNVIKPVDIDDEYFINELVKEIGKSQGGEGFGSIWGKVQRGISKIMPRPKITDERFGEWRPQPTQEENAEWAELYKGIGPEIHVFRHNFCGPMTRYQARIARGDKPVSYLDLVSQTHDRNYYELSERIRSGEFTSSKEDKDEINRLAASYDDQMMRELRSDPTYSSSKIIQNLIIKAIFWAKRHLMENTKLWEASKFVGVKPEDIEKPETVNSLTDIPQIGNGVLPLAMIQSAKSNKMNNEWECCRTCDMGVKDGNHIARNCEWLPGYKLRIKMNGAKKK
jgi:hypothetical protein